MILSLPLLSQKKTWLLAWKEKKVFYFSPRQRQTGEDNSNRYQLIIRNRNRGKLGQVKYMRYILKSSTMMIEFNFVLNRDAVTDCGRLDPRRP